MEPPIYLSYGGSILTSSQGFVYSMAYFTEEQMNDARWEADRTRRAQWNYCKPKLAAMIRRDVRWFEPATSKAKRCAMVVYTMQCPTPKAYKDPSADAFAENRESILSQPPDKDPPEASCGEKNGFVRFARSYGKGVIRGGLRFGWFEMQRNTTGDEPNFVPLTTNSKVSDGHLRGATARP